MELKTFFDNFELMAEAPGGVQKLREMVLQLAVQGKLVPQDPNDEPASVLLERVSNEKVKLIDEKMLRKVKPLPPPVTTDAQLPLPENWEWVHLDQVCYQITDGTHFTPTYTDKGVPFLSVKDVTGGKIDFSDTRFISEKEHMQLTKRCKPELNDVLLTKVGTTGIARVIDTDREFSIFVSLALLKFPQQFIFPFYLELLINSPLVREQSKRGTQGVGNKNLVIKQIRSFIVPLPPYKEQKRIVAKVDELMALCDELEARKQKTSQTCIQLNNACIDKMLTAREPARFSKHWGRIHTNFDLLYSQPENVQKLRQAILQLAVQGKLVPQDPNDEPASVLLEKIRAARQRHFKEKPARSRRALASIHQGHLPSRMPHSWAFERFGNIAMVSGGLTLGRKLIGRETGVFPYLRVANVQRWHVDLTNVKEVEAPLDELEKYRLIKGDILITEGGDWDKVGRSAIWEGEIENCLHQNHIFKARLLNGTLNKQWVIMFLNSPTGRTYFADASKQTTNLASINMTQLRNCIIPIPPIIEQKRIVAKVDELMALCHDLEAGLQKSQTKNDKLMEAAVAKLLAA